MNLTEATKLVAILQAAWPNHPWHQQAPQVYQMGLDDVSYDAVMAAMPDLIKSATFSPVPAEIRKAVLGDEYAEIPTGQAAWEEFTEQRRKTGSWGIPTFSHPLIQRTVDAFGWLDMCGALLTEQNTLRAQFERFHNDFRATAIADLRRGVSMELAILPHGKQRKIAGLVPVASPEYDDGYDGPDGPRNVRIVAGDDVIREIAG